MVWNLSSRLISVPFACLFCLKFTLPAPLIASQIARWTFLSQYILSLMIWIPNMTKMPTWLPLLSSKGSSLWLLLIVVYQGIPLFRRFWKTPCCTNPHIEGSRLSPRSYYPKSYFLALFLTILKPSLYFLQVFWLWSNIVLKNRQIWSWHPDYSECKHWFYPSFEVYHSNRKDNRLWRWQIETKNLSIR